MDIQGFSREFVILLLFFPVLATIMNALRYIVGFKTFGIYSIIAISYAFYLTGFRYGMILLFITFLMISLTHLLTRKIQMHYTARIATSYTTLAIGMLFLLYLISKIPFPNALNINIFKISATAVLLIVTLTDSIYQQLVNKDILTITRSFIESLTGGLIGLLLMRSDFLSSTIYNNAWIVPILVVVNILIGKYTGLRLLDLIRFRFIIKSSSSEQNAEKTSQPSKK